MAEDNRRLIPMSIQHLDGNKWLISVDGGESYNIDGDLDSIKRAVRRIKGKDGENCGKCRSSKVGTYSSMISDQDNDVHKINVWKSKVPHSADEFRKLMESRNMKSITLTKNYLIEGNIIPKGTVVEFKEKLDFLPTDVWEQAQAIKDEHERFEFIKSELNKLGDDYTDDEIEDFINKYKSQLNESMKKISKDDLSDMLFVIEDTLKFEKEIDIDTKEDILEQAETNKELITAWENLMMADDKSFNKKESKFWEAYDRFIKNFKLKNKEVA